MPYLADFRISVLGYSWPPGAQEVKSSSRACAKGEALIRQADRPLRESWNERLWADGGPIAPSPTVDLAVNGGYA
jgi:hypothetical protein